MSNVISIDQDNWHYLLLLRKTIKFYKDNFLPCYETALNDVQGMYSDTIAKVA